MHNHTRLGLVVRFKPPTPSETIASHIMHTTTSVTITDGLQTITLGTPRTPVVPIPPGASNHAVASSINIPALVDDCIAHSKDAIICCYGQSCSGKSYTMFGDDRSPGRAPRETTAETVGLVQLGLEAALARCKKNGGTSISASAQELHLNTVRALVRSTPIRHKDDIARVTDHIATRRAVSSTGLNPQSSRSHAFVLVTVEHPNIESDLGGESARTTLVFVDLAGSERTSKTHATGARLQEGIDINKSLSALGNVMRALAHESVGTAGRAPMAIDATAAPARSTPPASPTIPWRASKLTQLLKDYIRHDTTIWFILCISSDEQHAHESLSTLRFGSTVLGVKLRARDTRHPGGSLDSGPTQHGTITTDIHPRHDGCTANPRACLVVSRALPLYLCWTLLMVWYAS